MLSDIIKQSGCSDTRALAEILSEQRFFVPVEGDKEKYLANLISICAVALPREIIPDDVTLHAFTFTYKKDPLTLPILLRYFTHKNLLKEAKDDLDKLNQKLQGVMDEELKKLQDERKLLCEETAELSGKEVDVKQGEVLVTKSKKITETASRIEEIKLYKEDIKNLLNGDKVKMSFYPWRYLSILDDELTKVMKKKLTAYVKDDTNIEKIYQSLNSRAKKIIMLKNIQEFSTFISLVLPFVSLMVGLIEMSNTRSVSCLYFLVIPLSTFATFFATAGVAYLIEMHYEQSFAKEMQDFIEGPKYVDKATNTEDVEGLGQEEKKVNDGMNYKGKPSAPPYQPGLYPDLSEELLALSCNKKDSQPSSNFDSVLPLPNTARGVI